MNAALIVGLALAAPLPALADVKAGADAWSRGDFPAAVREWQGPAAAGDADAQFNLGQAYRLGRGVPRDLARAEDLFGKAAAQGHVQAADNYGLLLFDRGERDKAMPYVRAAADRGEPRAQYLMGIAHFNGDLAPKDWRRAYALMTLAQGAGLPQATTALAQMDRFIPMADRQAAASLAGELAQQAEARRTSQLAAVDLADQRAPGVTGPARAAPAPMPPAPSARPPVPPIVRPDAAVAAAVRTAGTASPATAGADYARPAVPAAPPAPRPAPVAVARPAPAAAPAPAPKPPVTARPAEPARPAAAKPAPTGSWRVQLGAFGVPANADALWARVRSLPPLAGHGRINAPSGKVTKLQAGGFASREAASSACAALSKAGFTCIPAQD